MRASHALLRTTNVTLIKTTRGTSVTQDGTLPRGNSNLLEEARGVDARIDARRPADGQFPFFTAPSLKRVLRSALIFSTITAVYKEGNGEGRGERGEEREGQQGCDEIGLQMNRPEGRRVIRGRVRRDGLFPKYAANSGVGVSSLKYACLLINRAAFRVSEDLPGKSAE